MKSLADRVVKTIDSAIHSFDPLVASSYGDWDAELSNLEAEVVALAPADEAELLASLRAHRILLADECRRYEIVIDLSSSYLGARASTSPDFAFVAAARIGALHHLGRHEAEISEALDFARSQSLQESGLLFLLEGLFKRHPGTIEPDDAIWLRCQEEISKLHQEGFLASPFTIRRSRDGESDILKAAAALREAFRARQEELLADS